MTIRKIQIEYEELNSQTTELTVMSISIDYPSFLSSRKIYLYEIASIESINSKLENYLNSEKYLRSLDYLSPIYLTLNKKEFNELEEYLKEQTIYEEIIFNEDYARLNMAINIYRQDPKFWSVD